MAFHLPPCGAVLGLRGFGTLHKDIYVGCSAYQDFDALLANIENDLLAKLRAYVTQMQAQPEPVHASLVGDQTDFAIVGYSKQQGRMVGFWCGGRERGRPFTMHPFSQHSFMPGEGNLGMDLRYEAQWPSKQEIASNPASLGEALVRVTKIQRDWGLAQPGPPQLIGGEVVLWTITTEGVSHKVVHTWPDDKIGAKPEKVPGTSWESLLAG